MSESNGSGTSVLSVGHSGLCSMAEACKIAGGVHPNTVRKWANSGRLPTYRIGQSAHSKRRFKVADLEEFLGIKNKEREGGGGGKILAYIRISDSKRAAGFAKGLESDMSRQRDRLVGWSKEHYGAEPILFSDIGSGLSYETRKGFTRLIKQILAGRHDHSVLLVENKDRLARFGVSVLEWLCEAHSVKLIYTDKHDENESEAKELADDLLSIIHVFSSRSYAMRFSKRATKKISDEALGRIRELRNSGMAISRVADLIGKEGYRTEDSCFISVAVIRRLLQEKPQLETQKEKSSIGRFYCDCIEHGDHNLRLKKRDLYAHYLKWAEAKKIAPVTIKMAGSQLLAMGIQETRVADARTTTAIAWVGIKIRGENLAYSVVSKPRHKPLQTVESNNFVLFYEEKLKGRFLGYRKQLDRDYLAWCQQQNVKKISLKNIPRLLMELGNHYPTNRKEGFIYDLTKKPPTHYSSNS